MGWDPGCAVCCIVLCSVWGMGERLRSRRGNGLANDPACCHGVPLAPFITAPSALPHTMSSPLTPQHTFTPEAMHTAQPTRTDKPTHPTTDFGPVNTPISLNQFFYPPSFTWQSSPAHPTWPNNAQQNLRPITAQQVLIQTHLTSSIAQCVNLKQVDHTTRANNTILLVINNTFWTEYRSNTTQCPNQQSKSSNITEQTLNRLRQQHTTNTKLTDQSLTNVIVIFCDQMYRLMVVISRKIAIVSL